MLDHLGVARTDLLGFSLGGFVAVEFARRHPGRLGRLVLASVTSRPDGYHDEIRSPDARPGVGRMPTEDEFAAMERAYRAVVPDPDHFHQFAAKAAAFVGDLRGWSDEDRGRITGPVLVLVGDRDFVRVEHAAGLDAGGPRARPAGLDGVAVAPGTEWREDDDDQGQPPERLPHVGASGAAEDEGAHG